LTAYPKKSYNNNYDSQKRYRFGGSVVPPRSGTGNSSLSSHPGLPDPSAADDFYRHYGEDEEMPLPQWAFLTIIDNHPEIDQSRLAEIVSIDKTNTGRLVDLLEAKGLVERLPNSSDRRVWMLRCTPLGRKTRNRLLPRALDAQKAMLSCLQPVHRALFVDLMSQVVAQNEKYIRPGAGRRKPNRS
jgi:DNA-binding MarR family transcriptional regulator